MVPIKVAQSRDYQHLAMLADKVSNRVMVEGDSFVSTFPSFRSEVFRIIEILPPEKYGRLAYRAFNVSRGRVEAGQAFFRGDIFWVPGIDGMADEMLRAGRYVNDGSVQSNYLRWLKKEKAYRRRFDGMYAEFLAFFMDKMYESSYSWEVERWLVDGK